MEAPEKIYLTKNLLGELRDGWDALPSEVFTNIEYIRKDVFIEKTEKWLKEHVLEYVPEMNFGVWKADPDYYTKNFIEHFKKYMEE